MCLNVAHDRAQVMSKTLHMIEVVYIIICCSSYRFVPNMEQISCNTNVDFVVLLPPSFVLAQHISVMPAIMITVGSRR